MSLVTPTFRLVASDNDDVEKLEKVKHARQRACFFCEVEGLGETEVGYN